MEETETNTVEKATPSEGVSWWLKWLGSLAGIAGALLTAQDMYPYNLAVGSVCFASWAIVGLMWHDRSLIVMNIFLLGVYANSLLDNFIK